MCISQRSDEKSQSQSEQIILDYHPTAIDELIDAARFYESQQPNLGYRFLDAVDVALDTSVAEIGRENGFIVD